MLGRICREAIEEKTRFQLRQKAKLLLVERRSLDELDYWKGGNVKMTFFFSFSFFDKEKVLSRRQNESHIALAPSQIHALGIIHFALAHGSSSQQQSAAMTTIVESQQSHVLHKFGANVCGETSEAFCISFPTNTPLPRRSISSILLLLRW